MVHHSTSSDTFGDLRSLLHQPSTHNWHRIIEWAEMCEPSVFASTLMPYMLALLETRRWQTIPRAVPKRWLRAIAQGEPAPWIRLCNTLKIHFKPQSYERVFGALCLQPWLLDGLHTLHISGDMSDAHLAMIPGIRPRFRLHTLRVDGHSIHDEALARLLSLEILQGLRTLICKSTPIGTQSIDMLCHAPHLQDIACLLLRGTSLTPERFARLLKSPSSCSWRHLDISSRQPGWSALTHCHQFTQHNHLHDEGLRLLAKATHIEHLESLCFSHSHITNLGIHHLSRARHMSSLRYLDLSYSHAVTDAAVDMILHSTSLHGLESLDLSHCALTNEGIAQLNTSHRLPHLKELNVTGNLTQMLRHSA